MTDTALLEEIGRMLRGHYTALKRLCRSTSLRSSIGSRLIRTKPEATGVDEAAAAIFCPNGRYLFDPASRWVSVDFTLAETDLHCWAAFAHDHRYIEGPC